MTSRQAEAIERVAILGAAGRDFHNFNVVYRGDPRTRVVAFTATQIPGIDERRYPAALSGPLYPDGIPIVAEADLEDLCARERVDRVILAYSDLAHETVMHLASRALASGADFELLGPARTMLEARRPVLAVSAVRTGCGKSQTARWLGARLRKRGLRVAVIRHPMPYGDLAAQRVQRFATREDLSSAHCTVEEREEYEPHIASGAVVFAGVDYAEIFAAAEREADLLLWDGGNNDFPFVRPDLHLALVDPLRPGDEVRYHPGEAVLRMADVIVITKVDSAAPADVQRVAENASALNPRAPVVRAASPVRLEDPAAIRGKRVLVVEDGPTLTHGGMSYGAGYVAASREAPRAIIDPRSFAEPEIRAVYEKYPHIGPVLPAVGYSESQLEALRRTIEASDAEVVVSATPIDLKALTSLTKSVVRARYDFQEAGEPGLGELVDAFLARVNLGGRAR